MRKKLKLYLAVITTTAVLLTGCGASESSSNISTESAASTTESSVVATALSTSQVVVDTEFTANDLEVGYDESTAATVTLNGNDISVTGEGAVFADGVLTINAEGTYVLSGTLDDGQIVIDVEDTEKVHIILNGVTIHNEDNAAIYVKSADKVFITLEEGTVNTLTDGSAYVQADDNNVDGVIYSKADLTINGGGTLNITASYKHGIASKDDLIITGGTINITAQKDALNGKDAVKIKDGTINLTAETGNGIQSKNDEDTTKGFVYIAGGDITVANSQEGIEGTVIQIDGGIINIISQDDGINASSGTSSTSSDTQNSGLSGSSADSTDANSSAALNSKTDSTSASSGAGTGQDTASGDNSFRKDDDGSFGGGGSAFENNTDCFILINGGTVTVNASGDGIDSNGSISVTGGTIYISGPTDNGNGALDYNGTAEISGGTVIAAGSTGMAQGFSDTSAQYSLLYNLSTVSEAGTEITLTDKEGNVIVSFIPEKQYQSIVISSPALVKDETYTLTSGSQTADITLSSVVTSNAASTDSFGGSGTSRPSRDSQDMPAGQDGSVQPNDTNTTESTQSTDTL